MRKREIEEARSRDGGGRVAVGAADDGEVGRPRH